MSVSLFVFLVAVVTGFFGLVRGVRAEAITFCGIVTGAFLFGNRQGAEPVFLDIWRIPAMLQGLTRGQGLDVNNVEQNGLNLNDEQQLFLSIAFFVGMLVISYILGSFLGGPSSGRLHSVFGLMVGLSGGALSVNTLVNVVSAYTANHKGALGNSIALPDTSQGAFGAIMSYAPSLLFATLAGMAVFAAFSLRRTK